MPATTSTRPASMTAPVEPHQVCDDAGRAERPEPAPDDHQGRHRGELQRGRSDVIHYTIVATNNGNTTLAAVTDHRSERRPRDLHAGQRLVAGPRRHRSPARPRHTITQADIDAGHYLNTACVDDGAGGAAQVCATQDVPASRAPALSITKDATEASYNAVGQTSSTTRHGDQQRQHDARRGDHHRSERRPRDVHAGQRLVAGPRRHRSPARRPTRSPRPTSMPATTSTRPASNAAGAARSAPPPTCRPSRTSS